VISRRGRDRTDCVGRRPVIVVTGVPGSRPSIVKHKHLLRHRHRNNLAIKTRPSDRLAQRRSGLAERRVWTFLYRWQRHSVGADISFHNNQFYLYYAASTSARSLGHLPGDQPSAAAGRGPITAGDDSSMRSTTTDRSELIIDAKPVWLVFGSSGRHRADPRPTTASGPLGHHRTLARAAVRQQRCDRGAFLFATPACTICSSRSTSAAAAPRAPTASWSAALHDHGPTSIVAASR